MTLKYFDIFIWAAIFLVSPVFVIPDFLDYAQEAKMVLLLIVGACCCLKFAVTGESLKINAMGGAKGFSKPVLTGALIFIVMTAFSFWQSPVWQVGLHTLRNDFVPILIAGLVLISIHPKNLNWGLLCGATLIALLGIGQVATDIRALTPVTDAGQFPGVTFGNRGLASLFVALGVFPSIYLARNAVGRRNILLYLAAFVQILFIGVTMTRSVWGSLLLGGIVYFLGVRKVRRRDEKQRLQPKSVPTYSSYITRIGLLTGLLIFLSAGAYLVLNHPALHGLLQQRLTFSDWLENPRLQIWLASLVGYSQGDFWTWLIGFGPGSFQILASDWLGGRVIAGRQFIDIHNDYLQILLEYGALGLCFRLCLVYWLLKKLWRIGTESPDTTPLPLLASLVVILGSSLLFYPLRLPYFIFLFSVIALSPIVQVQKRILQPKSWKAILARFGMAALLICFTLAASNRIEIEQSFRTYVRTPGSFVVKLKQKKDLKELTKNSSLPGFYMQMLK